MTKNLLLLAALALPISACGGDEADTTATVVDTDVDGVVDDGTMDVDPMATGTMADDVTVDGTIAAAGSDLTALDPAAAVANIDGWIAKLDGAEFDQAEGIREGLNELKAELTAVPLDGAAIGETLADLGDLTTQSAATAATSSQEGLRTLGGALSAAGSQLGGSSM